MGREALPHEVEEPVQALVPLKGPCRQAHALAAGGTHRLQAVDGAPDAHEVAAAGTRAGRDALAPTATAWVGVGDDLTEVRAALWDLGLRR